jgi:TonB family protein
MNAARRWNPRVWLALSCVVLVAVSGFVSAQPGQPTTFTGNVKFMETPDLGPVRIHFDPGARTFWHTHAGWQVIIAEDGHGRTQMQGGTIQDLVPRQPVFAPGGVPHWHGATPDQALTQVTLNKGDVTWLGPVSDDDYRGRRAVSAGTGGASGQPLPDARGAYRPGNGITLPRVLRDVKPQYTSDAMRAKIQGTVMVECVVQKDGSVGDVQVLRSLDPTFGLDQEAINAAKQWRFVPGSRMGEPVPVVVTIELTFVLGKHD